MIYRCLAVIDSFRQHPGRHCLTKNSPTARKRQECGEDVSRARKGEEEGQAWWHVPETVKIPRSLGHQREDDQEQAGPTPTTLNQFDKSPMEETMQKHIGALMISK